MKSENKQLESGKYYLQLLDHGYAIVPYEISRTPQILGPFHDINYLICYEINMFTYCAQLGDYIDFYSTPMSGDTYGGRYTQGRLGNRYGYHTYYVYNGCEVRDAFVCDANYMASNYCYDGRKNGTGSAVMSKLNSNHKHICAVTANFIEPYAGEDPFDLLLR